MKQEKITGKYARLKSFSNLSFSMTKCYFFHVQLGKRIPLTYTENFLDSQFSWLYENWLFFSICCCCVSHSSLSFSLSFFFAISQTHRWWNHWIIAIACSHLFFSVCSFQPFFCLYSPKTNLCDKFFLPFFSLRLFVSTVDNTYTQWIDYTYHFHTVCLYCRMLQIRIPIHSSWTSKKKRQNKNLRVQNHIKNGWATENRFLAAR